MFGEIVKAGLEVAELKIDGDFISMQMEWRKIDLRYRRLEHYRRAVDNKRREVSEKAEQLKAIGMTGIQIHLLT